MRVIYRSASKRTLLSPPPGSLTQEALGRLKCALPSLFRHLGNFRSGLCRLLLCGLAWSSFLVLLIPWAGPLALTLTFWRRWVVSWISHFLAEPEDRLETSTTFRNRNAGVDHLLITIKGSPNQENIKEHLSRMISSRSSQLDGWKLTRSLIRLFPGCWVWRANQFRIEDHVTFCEELWRGAPLNEQSLKYSVNELCGSCLPNARPLWQIHVVPFLQSETRSSCHALLVRSHHLLAHFFRPEDFYPCETEDKILRDAVVNALSRHRELHKLQEEDVSNKFYKPEIKLQNLPLKSKPIAANKSYSSVVLSFFIFLWRIPGIIFRELFWLNVSEPVSQSEIIQSTLLFFWEIPGLIFHEIVCSIHNAAGKLTCPEKRNRKALSWSDPIPMELLVRIKETSRADSVQTVLYSCLAGALNHYRRMAGCPKMNADNLRSLQPIGQGFLGVFLPVDESCPKARLRKVQRSIRRGIEDNRLPLSYLLSAHWARFLPESLARFMANLLAQRYPVLVESLKSGAYDCSVVNMQRWKIHQADVGLFLGLVEHSDQVTLCVMSDIWAVERPDLLASNFNRAALDLALILGVRCERRATPPESPTRITPPGTPAKFTPGTLGMDYGRAV